MFVSLDVFLFKQKTAYEMRISDWSSDVCSSDLIAPSRQPEIVAPGQPFDSAEPQRREFRIGVVDRRRGSRLGIDLGDASRERRRLAGAQEARSARQATEQNVVGHGKAPCPALRWRPAIECQHALRPAFAPQIDVAVLVFAPVDLNDPVSALDGGAAYFAARSEEHTSELQSLMP